MNERRLARRIPTSLTVQYQSGEQLRRDRITDRSSGGLFIRTSRPLPIGTELDLIVEIEGEPPIRVRGKVVWERLYGKGAPPHEPEGMGVAFLGTLDPRIQGWSD